jgi:hypothetical protein
MYELIAAFVIAIVIIIIWRYCAGTPEGFTNIDQIILAVDMTQKRRGDYAYFQSLIRQNPSVTVYKYAQLVTLYKTGHLTQRNATIVLFGR